MLFISINRSTFYCAYIFLLLTSTRNGCSLVACAHFGLFEAANIRSCSDHSANSLETNSKPHQTISLLIYFKNQTNSIHLLFHPNQSKLIPIYSQSKPNQQFQLKQTGFELLRLIISNQFSASSLDRGSTYSFCYAALHRVVASHTESSPTSFSQFQ